MIKRTIEISREPMHLAVQLDQLRLLRKGDGESVELAASIPCEDLGLVVVDHPQTTYTHLALASLMKSGAAVMICGHDHLPAGLLLPISTHTEVLWRLRDQLAVSKPLQKQLWKQLVVAKIRGQAANLEDESIEHGRLLNLARGVRSGDTSNVEAQAAKVYWSHWLGKSNGISFRRDTDGTDALNSMLNYGYAVVRAAVARALVSAGLLPALGLHHANRSNAFCLADDLMEPLRPIIDARVRRLHRMGREGLDQPTKASLLELLTMTVRMTDDSTSASETGPLMVALHAMAASLVRCYRGETKVLGVAVPVEVER